MKGINTFKHKSSEYITVLLYFIEMQQDHFFTYASIQHELHLVKGLKVNILVRNNILSAKRILINIVAQSAFIQSCNITIQLKVKQKSPFI